jgi:electron transfer flavoprotein alpha/beta subunit
MMKAKKKEIRVIPRADLGLPPPVPTVELLGLQTAPDRGRGGILEGDPGKMVRELLRLLREEARVL